MKKFSKVISAVTASAMMMTASISTFGSITAVDAADSMTAIEIVNDMGLGWNLGNTFDAWSTNYKTVTARAASMKQCGATLLQLRK